METSHKGVKGPQNSDIKQIRGVQAILTCLSFILLIADFPYTFELEFLLVIFLGFSIVYFSIGFWNRTIRAIGIGILTIPAS